MKEQLMITIPEPCHEDWNKMTPVEQGRFCNSCQKSVIDFASKTDNEVVDFFKNYNGNVCGSFTDDQLNRPIQKHQFKPVSSFLKYAASLLMPAVLIGFKAKAQGKVAVRGEATPALPKLAVMPGENTKAQTCTVNNQRIVIGGASSFQKINKEISFVFGRVVDSIDGKPLAGVSIYFDNNKGAAVSNNDGYFLIQRKDLKKGESLFISYVGYEHAELDITARRKKDGVIDLKTIYLLRKPKILNEVVVDGYASRRMGGAMGGVIIRYSIRDTIASWMTPQKIKLYPNPVSANSYITVSFLSTPPGIYQIRIINAAGQLFYASQKQITSAKEAEQIHLNEKMSAGVYCLQIIDGKKGLVQTNKIVVQ
jgi:CarboxypepD_reg-like domain/Secretion system C-terminal sorting domain